MTESFGAEDDFWVNFKDYLFSEEQLEEADKELEQILSLLDFEGSTVLDIPCGVGRHSVGLAEKGFEVTGVDSTPEYLEDARKRAAGKGVEFVESDMRDFVREGDFDLVLNLWNSFGYFEDPKDDRKVLENFYRSLKDSGLLVMDITGKEIMDPDKTWSREGENKFILHEYEFVEEKDMMKGTWIKIDEGDVTEYNPSFRIYSQEEMKEILEEIGFSQVKFYGNMEGEQYTEESERLMIVAQK